MRKINQTLIKRKEKETDVITVTQVKAREKEYSDIIKKVENCYNLVGVTEK